MTNWREILKFHKFLHSPLDRDCSQYFVMCKVGNLLLKIAADKTILKKSYFIPLLKIEVDPTIEWASPVCGVSWLVIKELTSRHKLSAATKHAKDRRREISGTN